MNVLAKQLIPTELQPLSITPGTPLHEVLNNRMLLSVGRLVINSTNAAELRQAAVHALSDQVVTTAKINPFTRNVKLTISTPRGTHRLTIRQAHTNL